MTFVRYGDKVAEPIVEEGQADVIIAFERLEALRYAHFLKKDGVLIVNDWRIDPIDVYKRQDIYRAKASKFQIIDGKLMPSLSSIEGMGDKAAEAVEEASKDGPYLSLDDFRQRTKVSKTVIDLMADLGLFGDLPQSNQLSLFDFT